MRILFLHPYGQFGDWNNRLRRQYQLMKKYCEIETLNTYLPPFDPNKRAEAEYQIKETINNFKPDTIYVNGFVLGEMVCDMHNNIVYDMGSFMSRTVLFETYGFSFKKIRDQDGNYLQRLVQTNHSQAYEREKKILEKAKAVISWDSEQIELIRKLFGENVNVKAIDMVFSDLPDPIPFENKEKNVISVAAKWTSPEKNYSLLRAVIEKIWVESIGHGGAIRFVEHSKLMDMINKSRVFFAPFHHGGCGTIMEALRLGCNVITGDWYPFNKYVNDELILGSGQEEIDKVIDPRFIDKVVKRIEMAMEKYYPPKIKIPSETEQIKKILKLCQKN